MQEGTSNGVVTDIDGNYTIEIKGASKATLVYSYAVSYTHLRVNALGFEGRMLYLATGNGILKFDTQSYHP